LGSSQIGAGTVDSEVGLKHYFESGSSLVPSVNRGFKSRARNHLQANRPLEFSFDIVI
jgi:hypothetical protein